MFGLATLCPEEYRQARGSTAVEREWRNVGKTLSYASSLLFELSARLALATCQGAVTR
ncbi:hypothetical protein PAXRUDRAFT_830129 [Paxillus rubicundulus Ve08.2h10]|uniref:Unplaced genomic scaffold scaffold_475, whole genome shotgun sequence n=1 Tax=Paxillus rubicundulus Ve08.2h10 TaxID=930991 RepID=A0A0D0E4N9_9AGAM|nr:hypothetical protein PAXRUDRAFT_830129 [Paxillus rubicundulus Ve08.2h10]